MATGAQTPHRCRCSSIATELAEGGVGVGAALGQLSLDLGGGGAVRPGTLLDEHERLAIEAQLSRAVLHRSYSEPSPSRLAAPLRDEVRQAARRAESEDARAAPRARRLWLLEALKRVLCLLGSAWGSGHGRRKVEEQATPCTAPAPRVQLIDYLR